CVVQPPAAGGRSLSALAGGATSMRPKLLADAAEPRGLACIEGRGGGGAMAGAETGGGGAVWARPSCAWIPSALVVGSEVLAVLVLRGGPVERPESDSNSSLSSIGSSSAASTSAGSTDSTSSSGDGGCEGRGCGCALGPSSLTD